MGWRRPDFAGVLGAWEPPREGARVGGAPRVSGLVMVVGVVPALPVLVVLVLVVLDWPAAGSPFPDNLLAMLAATVGARGPREAREAREVIEAAEAAETTEEAREAAREEALVDTIVTISLVRTAQNCEFIVGLRSRAVILTRLVFR